MYTVFCSRHYYHSFKSVLTACCVYVTEATVPTWIEDTARRYMGDDRILVDLIGKHSVRTAVNVLHKAICCPYQERPTIINDVIRVCFTLSY